jgi:hypothetical protein
MLVQLPVHEAGSSKTSKQTGDWLQALSFTWT